MGRDNQQIPEALKKSLRTMLHSQIKGTATLDVYELELFYWYVTETEKLLDDMLSAERAYIQEQIQAGAEDINDSGMVAVEYHLKRVRYSHAIYMTSLLETFLESSCERLAMVVGAQNVPFTVSELKGDQWSVKRKFLERYGKFDVPDNVWSKIQALIWLRNNLVHDNGSTHDLKPHEKTAFAKCPGIILSGHEVMIKAEYICYAFEAIRSLVHFVAEQLGEVVGRATHPKVIA